MSARRPSTSRPPAPVGGAALGTLAAGELPEPRVTSASYAPMWFVALLGLAAYWGALYLDRNGGAFHPLVFTQGELLADIEARVPRSEADALRVQGRKVYTTYCTACHQPNARGLAGQFPPLAGSDWVNTTGPNRMIRIVLNGLQGPIIVNGAEFNNVMLPWRDQLTDADIAAVITYVRGNKEWGNHSLPVLPEQVKKIREATKDRGGNWTAAELLVISDQD